MWFFSAVTSDARSGDCMSKYPPRPRRKRGESEADYKDRCARWYQLPRKRLPSAPFPRKGESITDNQICLAAWEVVYGREHKPWTHEQIAVREKRQNELAQAMQMEKAVWRQRMNEWGMRRNPSSSTACNDAGWEWWQRYKQDGVPNMLVGHQTCPWLGNACAYPERPLTKKVGHVRCTLTHKRKQPSLFQQPDIDYTISLCCVEGVYAFSSRRKRAGFKTEITLSDTPLAQREHDALFDGLPCFLK